MALNPKVLVQPDIQGQNIWMTNKTGVYADPNNLGGFGTPNYDLNTLAVAAVMVYNSTVPVVLPPIGLAIKFNGSAANTDEDYFEWLYSHDGWHTTALFLLPVSADGITDLNSNGLSEGSYFYYTANSKLCQLVNGTPVEVTDYSLLIDDASVIQVKCERMFMCAAAVAKKNMYRDYRISRDTKGECRETDDLFRSLTELRHDLEGVYDAFWSGMMTDAHSKAESLTKQYDL
jgi:hypothetical protein